MVERLYGKDGKLAYDGETLYGKPYGYGTVYWPDGHIRQQGIFDIKGLVAGRLFYPDGTLRFEGKLSICYSYGPNFPIEGSLYNERGELIYEGKFRISRGGVGYPIVVKPAEFGPCGPITSIPVPVFLWEDERRAYIDAGQTPPERIRKSSLELGIGPGVDRIPTKKLYR